MTDEEDRIWLERLAGGDRNAYRRLFDKYYCSLYSFALKFIGKEEDAEDIVQDVLFDLWAEKKSYLTVLVLKSYLYTTVRNRCLASIKHERVRRRYRDNEERKFQYDFFLEHLMEEEVYLRLKEAVDSLPPRIAEIYRLSLSGKNGKEICSMTGMTEDALKSLKKRGKAMLQERLKDIPAGVVILLLKIL